MANKDWPHGFIPVASLEGGEGYIRNYNKAVAYATAIGRFDLVVPTAAGTTIGQGVAAAKVFGVSLAYSAASTAATHPVMILRTNTILDGQTDASLVTADTNLNANFMVAAPNAYTGLSNMEINSATEATTSTLDLHLLQLAPYIDNASGTNSKWFCTPNSLYFVNQVVGI